MKRGEGSREAILARLRSQRVEGPSLPEVIEGDWTRYEDVVGQLKRCVEGVGGRCEVSGSVEELRERLEGFEEYRGAKQVLSLVPGMSSGVDLGLVGEASALRGLDFVIAPGEMAVAENGAVWVTDVGVAHRAVYFLTQYLVLVVKRSTIMHNMHEAYGRLKLEPRRFGCFISGPSKTADIEQSLVIGAHGCRSMQLYILAD